MDQKQLLYVLIAIAAVSLIVSIKSTTENYANPLRIKETTKESTIAPTSMPTIAPTIVSTFFSWLFGS